MTDSRILTTELWLLALCVAIDGLTVANAAKLEEIAVAIVAARTS